MMKAMGFIVQKRAESEADCQDRFSINTATGSVAVSDGMSQSLFPKYWAEILADRYTSERDWFPSRENVQALTPLWKERVDARLDEMRSDGLSTWRAENMLAEGFSAGATLVGLRILSNNHFVCDVLGDSCLVILMNGRIKQICSSMDDTAFGCYPDYYDSDPQKSGKGEVKTFEGEIGTGMQFLLVSDPLAEFIASFRNSWRENILVKELLSVESREEFEILVGYWRQDGMHNDDTTMVKVWPQV
jgi:serine/threonine protein phosphatase PrpC